MAATVSRCALRIASGTACSWPSCSEVRTSTLTPSAVTKDSPGRRVIVRLCMALLLGGWLDKLGPDVLPVVGAQVSSGDHAAGQRFNPWAERLWDRAAPLDPLIHSGRGNLERASQGSLAANKIDNCLNRKSGV